MNTLQKKMAFLVPKTKILYHKLPPKPRDAFQTLQSGILSILLIIMTFFHTVKIKAAEVLNFI